MNHTLSHNLELNDAQIHPLQTMNSYLLNKVCDVVDSVFHNNGLLRLQSLTLSLSLGLVQEAFLLGGPVFGSILQQQLEQAGGCMGQKIDGKYISCHFHCNLPESKLLNKP